MNICQSCGKEIKDGKQAVEIRYGRIYKYAKPPKNRVQYNNKKVDFFHLNCDKAFRNHVLRWYEMTHVDKYLEEASLAELFELQQKLGKAIERRINLIKRWYEMDIKKKIYMLVNVAFILYVIWLLMIVGSFGIVDDIDKAWDTYMITDGSV